MSLTLVLGGARSGKSSYAQALAELRAHQRGLRPVMIATAEALDAEMADRIARHRAERDSVWRTIEAPLDLAAPIAALQEDEIAVADCLTLWLSNLLVREMSIEEHVTALMSALERCVADVVLVSNEVGWGIVPDNTLARRFRDEAGRLHQRLAASCDRVELVVAGLPMILKAGKAD
jgi:adenosylcobinamide kinase/adenosylcobinamide-phosphate guanylyltransferase